MTEAGTPCFHCILAEAIRGHAKDHGDRNAAGDVIIDVKDVLGHVGSVVAELLAQSSDKKVRDKTLREFSRAIADEIPLVRTRYISNVH